MFRRGSDLKFPVRYLAPVESTRTVVWRSACQTAVTSRPQPSNAHIDPRRHLGFDYESAGRCGEDMRRNLTALMAPGIHGLIRGNSPLTFG